MSQLKPHMTRARHKSTATRRRQKRRRLRALLAEISRLVPGQTAAPPRSLGATDEGRKAPLIASRCIDLIPPVRPLELQLVQLFGCHQDGTWLGALGRADHAAPFEKVHEPAGPSEADPELALEHGRRA